MAKRKVRSKRVHSKSVRSKRVRSKRVRSKRQIRKYSKKSYRKSHKYSRKKRRGMKNRGGSPDLLRLGPDEIRSPSKTPLENWKWGIYTIKEDINTVDVFDPNSIIDTFVGSIKGNKIGTLTRNTADKNGGIVVKTYDTNPRRWLNASKFLPGPKSAATPDEVDYTVKKENWIRIATPQKEELGWVKWDNMQAIGEVHWDNNIHGLTPPKFTLTDPKIIAKEKAAEEAAAAERLREAERQQREKGEKDKAEAQAAAEAKANSIKFDELYKTYLQSDKVIPAARLTLQAEFAANIIQRQEGEINQLTKEQSSVKEALAKAVKEEENAKSRSASSSSQLNTLQKKIEELLKRQAHFETELEEKARKASVELEEAIIDPDITEIILDMAMLFMYLSDDVKQEWLNLARNTFIYKYFFKILTHAIYTKYFPERLNQFDFRKETSVDSDYLLYIKVAEEVKVAEEAKVEAERLQREKVESEAEDAKVEEEAAEAVKEAGQRAPARNQNIITITFKGNKGFGFKMKLSSDGSKHIVKDVTSDSEAEWHGLKKYMSLVSIDGAEPPPILTKDYISKLKKKENVTLVFSGENMEQNKNLIKDELKPEQEASRQYSRPQNSQSSKSRSFNLFR